MDRRMLLRSAGSAAVAGTLGALGVGAFATPAHAAPETINADQVFESTTNRVTRVPRTRGTITIEIRSGYYNGFQYGWGRIQGSGWDPRGWVWLEISSDGGNRWTFADATYLSDGTGYTHTSGWLTRADPNYVFRASYDSNLNTPNPYLRSGVW
ncbi:MULTISPECIES: hypothetical protein [unclassified Streptomyces]|uniref:hypothetical protein n=1 Tax=unclassified Streptomyces TaxID=2593676 RepID=UPI001661CAA9|nr:MULTISPECIES: hypothetical protein [unclassified Streptomyces]MBD0841282.1 hypothetical protein [Streptomyces sp. TRM68416]